MNFAVKRYGRQERNELEPIKPVDKPCCMSVPVWWLPQHFEDAQMEVHLADFLTDASKPES